MNNTTYSFKLWLKRIHSHRQLSAYCAVYSPFIGYDQLALDALLALAED